MPRVCKFVFAKRPIFCHLPLLMLPAFVLQELHRSLHCIAYIPSSSQLVVVGDNDKAAQAQTSQQLSAALSISVWNATNVSRITLAHFCGVKQVCIWCMRLSCLGCSILLPSWSSLSEFSGLSVPLMLSEGACQEHAVNTSLSGHFLNRPCV